MDILVAAYQNYMYTENTLESYCILVLVKCCQYLRPGFIQYWRTMSKKSRQIGIRISMKRMLRKSVYSKCETYSTCLRCAQYNKFISNQLCSQSFFFILVFILNEIVCECVNVSMLCKRQSFQQRNYGKMLNTITIECKMFKYENSNHLSILI